MLNSNAAISMVIDSTTQVFSTVTGNSSLGPRMRLNSFGVPSFHGIPFFEIVRSL